MKVTAETKFAVVPEWLLYAGVGDSAVRLYAVLARHADLNGRAHPSRGRLAELMHCSTKTVDRALKELVILGAVEVKERFERRAQTSNQFYLRTSDPATPVSLPLDTTSIHRRDADVPGWGDTSVQQNESLVLEVSSTASASVLPTSAPRAKDPIFEALFLLDAGLPYSKENRRVLTRKAADSLNAAVGEVRVTGISAEELIASIRAWPSLFGDATATAQAVAKHLPRLRAAANGIVARRETSELEDSLAQIPRIRAEHEAERERRAFR